MLFFSAWAKYVHGHTSALPFLHTNHARSLPAGQGLTPHSHHTRNKCTLIILYLMPLEVFYQTQIIILPCTYFCCFHGNQRCVVSCHYFYIWGVLQEVDIISMVRPYENQGKNIKNRGHGLCKLPIIFNQHLSSATTPGGTLPNVWWKGGPAT